MSADKLDELLYVCDEDDNVVGEATRGEVYVGILLHRAVHVYLTTSAGRLLIQRRSEEKVRNPGLWDKSAAGLVGAGESYDETAVREMGEELGVRQVKLRQIDYLVNHEQIMKARQGEMKLSRHIKVYCGTIAHSELDYQKSEVEEVNFVTQEELERLISEDKTTFDLKEAVGRYDLFG